METLEYFLGHAVEKALSAYLAANAGASLPIDVEALARANGITQLIRREMVPEALMQLEANEFRIYIQDNFTHVPELQRRQRFSIAHEIAHTFFYEREDGKLRVSRGVPKAEKLEQACHEAAGRLLVPDRFLNKEITDRQTKFSAADLISLSDQFEVSVEVVLRRLQSERVFDNEELAFFLVRRGTIEFAPFPPWLRALRSRPKRGSHLSEWLKQANSELRHLPDGSIECVSAGGVLKAKPFNTGSSLEIIEVRRLTEPQIRLIATG